MSCTTEQLMAENKKLKAENEKLGALAALGAEQVLSHHGLCPKDEEIKKLKKEVETLKETAHTNFHRFDSLMDENKKLKKRIEEDHKEVPSFLIKDLYLDAAEENKKLKAEWGILNNFCPEEAENNGQAVVDWICKFFKIEDDFGNLEEENKKLKEQLNAKEETEGDLLVSLLKHTEENKKLKETIQHCEGVMESDEDLEERLKAQHQIDMEEIMPLVTQVEEYEEMTEALAQYFSKIDQNACDVFNKLLPMWYGGDRAEIE